MEGLGGVHESPLMPHNDGLNFDIVFVLPLPLLRIFYSKSIFEYVSDRFQGHALTFRIEEYDEYPPREANARIESKRPAGSPAFHH